MSRVRGILWWCVLFAAGCSMSKATGDNVWDTAGGDDTADSDADTGGLDDSEDPVWWELGASLVITDGVLDANTSSLRVRMLDLDVAPMCEETLALVGAELEASTPDSEIYTWWRLSPAALAGDCALHDDVPPDELRLGIGALQADVRAVLGPAGYDGVADSLNGAYASLDGGETVYTFGVAGTEAAFAGGTAAATEAPLADGAWTIVALFPFDY